MDYIYLILRTNQYVNIHKIIEDIDNINEKIMLIDSNVKFNFTVYWTVLSIFIGVLGLVSWIGIRKSLEKKTEEYINKRLDYIISKVNQYKTIYGTKYIRENEMKNGECSFEIGSENLNIKFKKTVNRIDIQPIQGQHELEYKAEVKNGILNIKLNNFNRVEHKGIDWKITYLD